MSQTSCDCTQKMGSHHNPICVLHGRVTPDNIMPIGSRSLHRDFLDRLREVNASRCDEWGYGRLDPLFHATELGGEVGEVLNIVKKLVREERGFRGSRSSVGKLAEEIGDAIICLDTVARIYGIDMADAAQGKFNKTSEENGFAHRL